MVSSKAPGALLQGLPWYDEHSESECFVRERDVIWQESLEKNQGVRSLEWPLLPHKRSRE
jgi:hypothetical protein